MTHLLFFWHIKLMKRFHFWGTMISEELTFSTLINLENIISHAGRLGGTVN